LIEYKKKTLTNLDIKKDYEEIDTRLASGWYVDDIHISKKKIYKTNKTSFAKLEMHISDVSSFLPTPDPAIIFIGFI